MSQVVTLKRKIGKTELCSALDQIENLSLGAEHDWGCTIENKSNPSSFVTFSSGELEATSPSDELFEQLNTLALLLDATVVLEDEAPTVPSKNGTSSGREIVVFWPLLVLVLLLLLIWRW